MTLQIWREIQTQELLDKWRRLQNKNDESQL